MIGRLIVWLHTPRRVPAWWLVAAGVAAWLNLLPDPVQPAVGIVILALCVWGVVTGRRHAQPAVEDLVIFELLEAIRLTQEYAQFPALPGWTWWDTYRRYRPDDADRLYEEWLRHDRAWRVEKGWPTR